MSLRSSFWIWSRDDTLRYFLAGGGIAAEFEVLWASVTRDSQRFETAIAERTYAIGRLAELPCRRQKDRRTRCVRPITYAKAAHLQGDAMRRILRTQHQGQPS
jgi:hypothetical protein